MKKIIMRDGSSNGSSQRNYYDGDLDKAIEFNRWLIEYDVHLHEKLTERHNLRWVNQLWNHCVEHRPELLTMWRLGVK